MVDFNDGSITDEPTALIDGMTAIGYTRCVVVGYKQSPSSLNSILYLLLDPTKR